MFSILIIDDSFLKLDAYKKAFVKYDGIEVIDVLNEVDKCKDVLSKRKIDLIALNISSPLKEDVKKLKKIGRDRKIPLIFSGNIEKYSDSSLSLVEKKTIMIKKYIDRKKQTRGNEQAWLIVIGSSTGGPRALQQVLPKLPSDLNAIILVVQHMPANFTASLADRLDMSSAIRVKEAEDEEDLSIGSAYIAPGDFHMRIKDGKSGYKVNLNEDEKVKGLRPAVDVLMDSVAEDSYYNKMSIILTGMGNDGAEGVKKMKRSGSYNIIQDEASCVIYGMPRAAYETKCIDEIVELDKMAENILLKVGCKNGFRY